MSPQTWVTRTKLFPPQISHDVLPRPRLAEALAAAVSHHRLTLLSAPAGYGKTTAVVSSLPDGRFAWLTLDKEDNDPASFLTGLILALQQLFPTCGHAVQHLLNEPTNQASPRQLIGLLINDILTQAADTFTLVLDDLHVITEPNILAALDYLLERMPPTMHLVVTARAVPQLALAQLRARGQLAEFGPADLRFTLQEMDEWLNNRLQLHLSPAELQTLQHHSEGWIAGLRLLTLSLTKQSPSDERQTFINQLDHSRHIFDLLAEQVLNQQPTEIRQFLLETAVLHELTPALCTAVTQNPDAPLLLEEIYRRNLFLTAVSQMSASYRYHPLFAEFLHHQLQQQAPHQIQELNRRAGIAHPDPIRAVQHLFTAAAYEEAAVRLEQIAEEMFNHGRFDRLQQWISTLPDAERNRHPWLNFFLGVALWGKSQHQSARGYLEQALAVFTEQTDARGQGETMVQLSIVHQTDGDFAPASRYMQEALERPISPRSRAQSYMGLAWLELAQSNLPQAAEHLNAALTSAERNRDAGATNICMMQTRFAFQVTQQSPQMFMRLASLLRQNQPAAGSPQQAGVLGAEMFVHLLAGDLAQAVRAGRAAWHISQELGQLSWFLVDTDFLLARLIGLQGHRQEYDERMDSYRPFLQKFPGWRRSFLFVLAYDYWAQEQQDKMHAALAEMEQPTANEWPSAQVFVHGKTALEAMCAQAWTAAEIALKEAISLQEQIPVATSFLDMRLVLAVLYARQGENNRAVAMLKTVLDELVPAGKPGLVFLAGAPLSPILHLARQASVYPELCQQLLDQLDPNRPPEPLHLALTNETLTSREVEVLRLLVSGASNQQIAAQLVVSIPTVKTHVSRILSKLQVNSRSAAIARVREMQLPL